MIKTIPFTKMHGLGNDFVIINTLKYPISAKNLSIKQLSHRYLGIGFDQLLLLGSSSTADFSCQIFNADGSEAEQCGNGMRCIARFVHEEQLTSNKLLSIETKSGIVNATIHDYDHIQVSMGIPRIDSQKTTCEIDGAIDRTTIEMTTLSIGNPHAIVQVTSIEHCDISTLGPKISTHTLFSKGTNVGFMEIANRQRIRLRTYERGVGETFACGSNACAAVVAGIVNGSLDSCVIVELAFGNLLIEWKDNQAPVLMTGPASRVFDGELTPTT